MVLSTLENESKRTGAPEKRRCALNERDGGRGAFQGMGEECGQRINYTTVHSSGQGCL